MVWSYHIFPLNGLVLSISSLWFGPIYFLSMVWSYLFPLNGLVLSISSQWFGPIIYFLSTVWSYHLFPLNGLVLSSISSQWIGPIIYFLSMVWSYLQYLSITIMINYFIFHNLTLFIHICNLVIFFCSYHL